MANQQAIIYQGVPCYSFRQLDARMGAAKGHAFRAFKRQREELVEGVDYFYLEAEQESGFIEALRTQGLIYSSSRHLVLITATGLAKIL